MRRGLISAAVLAVLMVAATPAAAARTVRIKSSITLGTTLIRGEVFSPNHACIAQRRVFVRYKDQAGGIHTFGTSMTTNSGGYTISPSVMKGPAPYRYYAVAKRRSEGTAGTILVCQAATSKVRVVRG